jgi:hypothetical protein
MTSVLNGLRKRIEKLRSGSMAVPATAEAKEAFTTLRAATVSLCSVAGIDRDQWLHRCADGIATTPELALLDALPPDALKVAGMTAMRYVTVISRVLRDF